MNIKELTGQQLKKDLHLRRCLKRWHNHNRTGGNFGINLMRNERPHFEITGYHDLEGNVYNLTFGRLYNGVGMTLISKEKGYSITYEQMIKLIKKGFEKGDC